jgi:hypothetical protein
MKKDVILPQIPEVDPELRRFLTDVLEELRTLRREASDIMYFYDTGWIACSDWTDQHLGDSVGSNVNHALDAPLSELLVKVLISTDGTDANSFEVIQADDNTTDYGCTIYYVDDDNILVQTGNGGIAFVSDGAIVGSAGSVYRIDTESWYYKIKVWKL